jgi:hypothetical protein
VICVPAHENTHDKCHTSAIATTRSYYYYGGDVIMVTSVGVLVGGAVVITGAVDCRSRSRNSSRSVVGGEEGLAALVE